MGAILHGIRRVGGLAGMVLLVGTVGVARAQPLSGYLPASVPGYATMPGVTVLSQPRPDYQPPGIPIDSFLVSPSIVAGLGYDSNVLGGPGSPGSLTLGTHPSVTARSDWSSDSLVGILGLDDTRYLATPQQSRTDATAVFGGTLAVGRDELALAAAYLDRHEDRTSIDVLPSDTPVAYTVLDVRAGYTLVLDRLSLTPNIGLSRYQYSDTTIMGVPTSQSYRNRDVLAGGVTARYEIMPLQNVLLVLRGTGTNYLTPQACQPTRNSTGAVVLVGLSDDPDALWRYRLLVGWEERQFAARVYHPAGHWGKREIWPQPADFIRYSCRLWARIMGTQTDGNDANSAALAGRSDRHKEAAATHTAAIPGRGRAARRDSEAVHRHGGQEAGREGHAGGR
jgi:hypothetical protein